MPRFVFGSVRQCIRWLAACLACAGLLWVLAAAAHPRDAAPGAPLALTEGERALLQAKRVLRVGTDRVDYPPIEMFGGAAPNGGTHGGSEGYSGISADYMRMVAQRLGIEIELVSRPDWPGVLQALARDEVDIVPTVVATPQRLKTMRLSDSYLLGRHYLVLRDAETRVRHADDLAGLVIASQPGYVQRELVAGLAPGVRFLDVDTPEAALRAVFTGAADGYVGSGMVISYLLSRLDVSHLAIRGEVNLPPEAFTFAVSPRQPELLALVNKALADITAEEHLAVRTRWLASPPAVSTLDLARTVWPFVLMLVAAGVLLFVWNRRLQGQVTHRRVAERAAQAARQQLDDMANALPVVVFQRVVAQGISHYTFVGRSVKELLGCSADDLVREPELRWRCVHEDDLAWSRARVEEAMQHGLSGSFQFRVRVAGRIRWVESLTTATRRPDGACVFNGAWRDITELAEAQQVARAAANAKSAFLANMSHEIRTPMNAILGMARLALGSGLDARQRKYVQKVERAAQSLLGLINDILDFSKIEAGKLDMERAPFDLNEVMDSLASMVGLQAEEKGLELVFRLPADVPTALVGDALRLGQVLVNLGGNAVKFTDRGEVELAVSVLAREAGDVLLRFSVRDTGVGMDASQRERLFRPFEQVDSSTSRRHGGTGLGLAISSHLVRQMGGDLDVESQPGRGSEFSFAAHFGVQPQQPVVVLPELAGRRVLVLDDHPVTGQVLAEMAEGLGLVAETARDGWDVLRRVALGAQAGEPFDLVLLDFGMPGMDGLECARQIGEALPVVLLTTGLNGDDLLQRLQEGGDPGREVLTKPVTPVAMRRAFLAALGHAAATAEGDDAHDHGLAAQAPRLAGRRVLLVEDNLINQELAVELLESAGLQVTVAENGKDALDRLNRLPFDAVLMDCQMPVMDGYEATRAIRAQPRWQSLPVIAMTANVMASDRERALEAGMNDHIAKPIEVGRMFEVLGRWMPPPGGGVAAPSVAADPATDAPTDPLADLPGLDAAAGRAAAAGNEQLYRRLLVRFRDSQRGFAQQMRQALDADPVLARRLAHDLRSVSGSLGMPALSEAAGQLEAAVVDGTDPEAPLGRVLRHLAPVIEGLEQVPATP